MHLFIQPNIFLIFITKRIHPTPQNCHNRVSIANTYQRDNCLNINSPLLQQNNFLIFLTLQIHPFTYLPNMTAYNLYLYEHLSFTGCHAHPACPQHHQADASSSRHRSRRDRRNQRPSGTWIWARSCQSRGLGPPTCKSGQTRAPLLRVSHLA
jgi:hypothetical protein